MNIQEQINKVEELEKNYLAHKYIRTDENSLESIRIFKNGIVLLLFFSANLSLRMTNF